MFMGKRGMFGAKPAMQTQREQLRAMPAGLVAEKPMQQEEERKPGLGTRLFGQGWEEKAAAIGGALRDDDGGRSIAQFHQMRQMQQQQAQEAEMAQRAAIEKRDTDWQEWVRRQEYERNNPKPVNNDTVNDFEWYKGLTPEERAMYHEMKPEYRQGPDGRFYRVGASGGVNPAAPPTAPVGKLTPIGGPSQPAAGNFPG